MAVWCCGLHVVVCVVACFVFHASGICEIVKKKKNTLLEKLLLRMPRVMYGSVVHVNIHCIHMYISVRDCVCACVTGEEFASS